MTTLTDMTATQGQTHNGMNVPMFMSSKMEQPMANDAQTQNETQKQDAPLSVFDVKELYDLAYAEKAKGLEGEDAFKMILAEAVKLDMAYRRQLSKAAVYKDHTKIKNFKDATLAKATGSKVA